MVCVCIEIENQLDSAIRDSIYKYICYTSLMMMTLSVCGDDSAMSSRLGNFQNGQRQRSLMQALIHTARKVFNYFQTLLSRVNRGLAYYIYICTMYTIHTWDHSLDTTFSLNSDNLLLYSDPAFRQWLPRNAIFWPPTFHTNLSPCSKYFFINKKK